MTGICGSLKFSYAWIADTPKATIVGKHNFFVAGMGRTVRYVEEGNTVWEDKLSKSELVGPHIEVSQSGDLAAVAVKTLYGGSDLFDFRAS